jgi:hypothetical protein
MSESLTIKAFRSPDEKWQNMKDIWDACEKASVIIPEEVEGYFNGENPDPAGIEIDIGYLLEEWDNDGDSGYQIDVNKLPNDIKYLRIYFC